MDNPVYIKKQKLQEYLDALYAFFQQSRTCLITSPAGTHIECRMKKGRECLYCMSESSRTDGSLTDIRFRWAPDFESVNGTIVLDGELTPIIDQIRNPIRLTVERGYVIDIVGDGTDVEQYLFWLNSYKDPNAYLVSEVDMDFKVRIDPQDDVSQDLKNKGVIKWVFGNGDPLLLSDIPGGIPVETTSGGTCNRFSCWIDQRMLVDQGVWVGPGAGEFTQ